MPRRRRNGKRGAVGRVSQPRPASTNASNSGMLHFTSQLFPERMRVRGHFVVDDNVLVAAGLAAFTRQYKGNSLYLSGPASTYGGAFSANVPSGWAYLFDTNAVAGADGAYKRARIYSSSIHVLIVQGTSATIPLAVTVGPSQSDNFTGMTRTQIAEQKYFTDALLPISTTSTTQVLSSTMSTALIYGIDPKFVQDVDYSFTSVADPTFPWYWHVRVDAIDGTTTVAAYFRISIEYDIELFDRNNWNSTTPTLSVTKDYFVTDKNSTLKTGTCTCSPKCTCAKR